MSSSKWRPFCLGLDMQKFYSDRNQNRKSIYVAPFTDMS